MQILNKEKLSKMNELSGNLGIEPGEREMVAFELYDALRNTRKENGLSLLEVSQIIREALAPEEVDVIIENLENYD